MKTTYQYVLDLKQRLEETCEAARNQLAKSSRRYKKYFDVKARERRFEVGDMALLLLPTTANKLKMQWKGPFQIVRKVARHDYRMHVNGKEKTYHANLLKKYVSRSTPEPMVPHEDTSSEEPIAEAQHLTVIDDHISDDGSVEIVLPTIESSEGVDDVEIDPNLEEERREELLSLLYEYNDVLTDIPGKTDLIEYDIRLTTEVPVRSKPYPVPHAKKETIRQEVETMPRMGVIEETTSPYASPVVLVVKKDGKNIFCVDYRRLNTVTVADNEPIPNIEELLTEIGDAKFFTKVDLSKGYWQIPVTDRDRDKTAFVTPEGQYQFRVLPFGMVNAPAVFTRMMRRLLQGLPHVLHYIDDILVFSSSWDDHIADVKRVFQRLREAHLTARPTKCHLACASVEFLGHVIGQGRMEPTTEKVQKVMSASRPTTVRSFLGLVGYYRKFIPNMSAIAAPLTDLTKKNAPSKVKWEEGHELAFRTLQNRLSNYPVLRLPDHEREFILRTDASDVGLGATLMQEYDEQYFPVYFASRKLLDRERVYPIVERECLALAWAVKKFAFYLMGRHFILQTDHYPLASLAQARMKNPRVLRWALALQAFQYRVQVIKGSENVGADFMSRCPVG